MEPVPRPYFEASGVRGSRHSIAISSSVSASLGGAFTTSASSASIELVWSGFLSGRWADRAGDDLVQLAGAILGALADRRRRLTADLAGRRLALAELAHVGDGRGRSRYRFGCADLRHLSDSGVFPLGSSTSTSPSQNAMRSRKTSRDPGRLLWLCCG